MRWSILIPTLSGRQDRFENLLDRLLPQTRAFPVDQVEVVGLWNHGEHTLGELRHMLLTDARGQYISFIDDDDMVPEYYCGAVMAHLAANDFTVDFLGWQVEITCDGQPYRPAFHSLRYTHWHDDENGLYRNAAHVNVIRREIALMGDYRRPHPDGPEDVSWVAQVGPHLKTESYIDKVMYHYRWASHDSIQNGTHRTGRHGTRPVITEPRFRYHPESSP